MTDQAPAWTEQTRNWCWDAVVDGQHCRVFVTGEWAVYNDRGGYVAVDIEPLATVEDAKAAVVAFVRGEQIPHRRVTLSMGNPICDPDSCRCRSAT